jgi:hypothetical protein
MLYILDSLVTGEGYGVRVFPVRGGIPDLIPQLPSPAPTCSSLLQRLKEFKEIHGQDSQGNGPARWFIRKTERGSDT